MGPFQLSSEAMAQTAQRITEIERQVKAAYLHKFTGFVEWPPGAFTGADSPIIIGVMGEDDLADELVNLVAGRTVNGRSLRVRKLQRSDSPTDIHVLFLGRLERNRLIEIYAALKGRPVLTVTDSDGAYALGSMVNFVVTQDRLRFEVALAPVEAGRLKISALMLAAAYKVVKEAL
ncbi:YfiR family protein [Ferribacterium limneticum]|uniref:YfiR family protein n=1 Tax=Ferribacterium limneticum TaxID=76259 RepID=UPI001CF91A1F|nr:YfiR family protein [Ferribacterium limneticum]UCV21503.1 YfiR family protein [Ferribacterium limneticum]